MNCLSCQLLQRTDSDRDTDQNSYFSFPFESPERSWSGNLSFRPPNNRGKEGRFRVLPENKVAPIGGHRRLHSTGGVNFGGPGQEPRLIRSSGMRRDWSFEDLRAIREESEPIAAAS